MDFEKEVLQSSGLVMVDMYADWCGPCKVLTPFLIKLEKAYGGRVRLVRVNVDRERGLATRYNVASIPTVLFVKGGRVISSIIGLKSGAVYAARVEHLLGQ